MQEIDIDSCILPEFQCLVIKMVQTFVYISVYINMVHVLLSYLLYTCIFLLFFIVKNNRERFSDLDFHTFSYLLQ